MLPSRFNPEEFQRTVQALREGTSAADMVARPAFDPTQHREMVSEAVHGRRVEDYRTALERGGFTYYPAGAIPPGCEATSPLDPPRPIPEGQWRRPAGGGLPRLALTDAQVTAWFSGPEELWTWLQNLKNDPAAKAKRAESRPIRSLVTR